MVWGRARARGGEGATHGLGAADALVDLHEAPEWAVWAVTIPEFRKLCRGPSRRVSGRAGLRQNEKNRHVDAVRHEHAVPARECCPVAIQDRPSGLWPRTQTMLCLNFQDIRNARFGREPRAVGSPRRAQDLVLAQDLVPGTSHRRCRVWRRPDSSARAFFLCSRDWHKLLGAHNAMSMLTQSFPSLEASKAAHLGLFEQ